MTSTSSSQSQSLSGMIPKSSTPLAVSSSAASTSSVDDALDLISDGISAVTEGCRLPVKMLSSDEWPKAEVISIRTVNAKEGGEEGGGNSGNANGSVTQYYVHFVDYNKRLDEWVTEDRLDTRRIEPPSNKDDPGKHGQGTGANYTASNNTGLNTPKKILQQPSSSAPSRPASPASSAGGNDNGEERKQRFFNIFWNF